MAADEITTLERDWLRSKLTEANQRTNAVVHDRDALQRRIDALENRKTVVVADVGVKCDTCGHVLGIVGAQVQSPGDYRPALESLAASFGWMRHGSKHTCPTCQGK